MSCGDFKHIKTTCDDFPEPKRVIRVKSGRSYKAFLKNVETNNTKALLKQMKNGTVQVTNL